MLHNQNGDQCFEHQLHWANFGTPVRQPNHFSKIEPTDSPATPSLWEFMDLVDIWNENKDREKRQIQEFEYNREKARPVYWWININNLSQYNNGDTIHI